MTKERTKGLSVWWFAFGYFACYVPYSALSKATSSGLGDSGNGIPGVELLPWSTLISLVGMLAFITLIGWWKHAGRRTIAGRSVPFPNRWTFLSGVCTSAIIATTTLAYTFEGISIVFMMLLMRGGVLMIAPIVDAMVGRRVWWFSWVGLALSLAALVAAFLKDLGFAITLVAGIDITVYLASYFFRLRFMSRLAKSDDSGARARYFVEEQMVATPLLVAVLAILAVVGQGEFAGHLRAGWTSVFANDAFVPVVLIGLFSQGTGIFGGLILLGSQENTYCVPVNRASSILAGVIATWTLTLWGGRSLSGYELVGAGLIFAAIVVLAVPTLMARHQPAESEERV